MPTLVDSRSTIEWVMTDVYRPSSELAYYPSRTKALDFSIELFLGVCVKRRRLRRWMPEIARIDESCLMSAMAVIGGTSKILRKLMDSEAFATASLLSWSVYIVKRHRTVPLKCRKAVTQFIITPVGDKNRRTRHNDLRRSFGESAM